MQNRKTTQRKSRFDLIHQNSERNKISSTMCLSQNKTEFGKIVELIQEENVLTSRNVSEQFPLKESEESVVYANNYSKDYDESSLASKKKSKLNDIKSNQHSLNMSDKSDFKTGNENNVKYPINKVIVEEIE